MRVLQVLTTALLATTARTDNLPMSMQAETLYATGHNQVTSVLYTIDQQSGLATVVGPTGNFTYIFSGGLTWGPDTQTLYASGYDTTATNYLFAQYRPALFSMNRATGAQTLVGYLDPNQKGLMANGGGGLAYDTQNHTLYGTGCYSQLLPGVETCDPGLFSINLSTGAASLVAVLPVGRVHGGGLAYDPLNNVLYATGSSPGGSDSELVRIDPSTGVEQLVGITESGLGLAYGGLDFDLSNRLLLADGTLVADDTTPSYLFTVDPETAVIQVVGNTGTGNGLAQGGLALVPLPIPEPSSMILLFTTLLAVVYVARKSV